MPAAVSAKKGVPSQAAPDTETVESRVTGWEQHQTVCRQLDFSGDSATWVLWDVGQGSWPSTPKGRRVPKELTTPCSVPCCLGCPWSPGGKDVPKRTLAKVEVVVAQGKGKIPQIAKDRLAQSPIKSICKFSLGL